MILPVGTRTPFFQAPGVALFQGDCLDVMDQIPGGVASLVFADPPYNLSDEDNQGMARKVRPHSPIAGDKGAWDRLEADEFEALITGFLDQSKRILRPGGTIIVCCSHHEEDNFKRWISERFDLMNRIVWHKTNPPPLFNKTRLVWSYESLFVARKPGRQNTVNFDAFEFGEMHDVWTGPICGGSSKERVREPYIDDEGKQRMRSVHPTQKPLWLVEKALRVFTNPGDLVVDPFTGVVTVPVACQRLGRRAIGIDLSSKFLTAGSERLRG